MPNQLLHTAAGHEIRINRYGFRGPDRKFKKRPGTLRLEVFGGSAGFDYHASGHEKSWPGALERKLAIRLHMPVEVINLALPGLNAFDSKINYLCFGRAFKPDAIIVYHTWNDLKAFRSLAHTPYRAVGSARRNKPLWQRVARATQIGRRTRNFLWTVTKRGMETAFRRSEDTGTDIDAPVGEKAFAWEQQNFLDFVTLTKADGVLPVLVSQATLCVPENMGDEEIRFALAPVPSMVDMTIPLTVESWLQVSALIEEVAREQGAIFVDGYAAVPHDLKHLRDHVHLHDPGSEVLAETIAGVLASEPRFLRLAERVRARGTGVPGERPRSWR